MHPIGGAYGTCPPKDRAIRMEMHQLRYFAKVADLGNVTRAAEACFVSQPSLSQQLAKLERELGQPLFERLGRGVRLTEAGRLFKRYCDQILSLTEDARTRVADDPDSGRIVLAAIPTVAPYFLPGVLTRFAKLAPRVADRDSRGHHRATSCGSWRTATSRWPSWRCPCRPTTCTRSRCSPRS